MTDSSQILKDLTIGKAALAPLGGMGDEMAGYKGYGYATVVEILSSALQNGNYLKMLNGTDEDGKNIPYNLGHFFIVINTDAFMGEKVFRNIAGNILRELRASKLSPHEKRIYTAGEKEHLNYLDRKDTGVPVGEALQKDLIHIRDDLKLSHVFPFENKI